MINTFILKKEYYKLAFVTSNPIKNKQKTNLYFDKVSFFIIKSNINNISKILKI